MVLFTLEEMKDKYIGPLGTTERDKYEYDLQMEIMGDLIKKTRVKRNLTQEELGKLVGVQKSQISKLENNVNNASISTIMRIYRALKADVSFSVRVENELIELN